ncbi:hypothetical protein EV715DRAFT_193743 [Schizophyllum commune]
MGPPADSLSGRSGVIGSGVNDVTNDIAEIQKGLDEIDSPRLERNKERARRRAAGEESVSDDEQETEDVTRYRKLIDVVKRARATQEGDLASGAGDPAQTTTSTTGSGGQSASTAPHTSSSITPPTPIPPVLPAHLKSNPFNDAAVLANTFNTVDDSIPSHLQALAFNSISPPLTLFQTDFISRLRKGQGLKFQPLGHGDNAKARLLDWETMKADDERHMARDQWQTAYNTFLRFIASLADPGQGDAISEGWARHYNRMISDPDFMPQFPAFRDFDIDMRAQFFQRRFVVNPDDPKWESMLNSAKIRHARDPITAPLPFAPPSASSPPRPPRSLPPPRPHPYAQSFREEPLCLRCGLPGHRASACVATTPSKPGRQFFVDCSFGRIVTKDGRHVCVRYNLGKCTSIPSAGVHGTHICSLCGANHAATQCTRN